MISTPEAVAIWRRAIQPQLCDEYLERLGDGLRRDDHSLLQGETYAGFPDRRFVIQVVGACAVAYAAWKGSEEPQTPHEVVAFFDSIRDEAQKTHPGEFDQFLLWFDWAERKDAFAALLAAVDAELDERERLAAERECVLVDAGGAW